MMNNKFRVFLLLLISSITASAQSTEQAIANGNDPNVLYRNEQAFGFFAHSRGFGINYYRGQHITGTRKRLLEVQLLNLKHPKEIKITNQRSLKGRGVFPQDTVKETIKEILAKKDTVMNKAKELILNDLKK